jgi:hypothetical protein
MYDQGMGVIRMPNPAIIAAMTWVSRMAPSSMGAGNGRVSIGRLVRATNRVRRPAIDSLRKMTV